MICGAAGVALIVYYGFSGSDKQKPEDIRAKVPSRVIETGPYGEEIEQTEKIGIHLFKMKVGKLYLKKTKTLGFDNALIKKPVARDIHITILKDNKKVLVLHKDHQNLKQDLSRIHIEKPEIIFPEKFEQPKKIKIDKKEKKITFYYSDRSDIWDLNTTRRYTIKP